jgi:hypothetical protein
MLEEIGDASVKSYGSRESMAIVWPTPAIVWGATKT